MSADYFGIIIAFAGGLGLFLYGMNIMASGLQKAAGSKMKQLLEILTKNKFLGVLIGAFVTAIIQSSSATTVMVVGFVNAGLMTLKQAVGIIMGANIGTTATSWIVSSAEWAQYLKPETLAPIAVAVGAAMLIFSKRNNVKQVGEIIVGFGVLFIGIEMMTKGVEPLSQSPVFKDIFRELGENPVLGVLAGAIVTAIIQSSSASVGILQSLAFSGLVTWNSAIYIIMGQNIGTCVTAMLSGIGASKNAKGAAYIHLLFNVIGSVFFSVLAYIFFEFINPEIGHTSINLLEISIAHTGFNVANTIIMYPFSNILVKIAEKIALRGKVAEDETELIHLDDRIMETPAFAIQNCLKEIIRMGYMAYDNLKYSVDAILNKNEEKIAKVLKREKNIDKFQEAITQYMIKLCSTNINESEKNTVMSLFHTVNDIERIGDHSENIVELAQFMIEEKIKFSDMAYNEMMEICGKAIECVENAVKALENADIEKAEMVVKAEATIDYMEKEYRAKHIERLAKLECDTTTGIAFLDTLTNIERVSDHALNVVQGILKRK